MQRIEIAKRMVGRESPVFVIAEAGSNHDQDFKQAKKLIELAHQAGADAVKFQVFQADKIVARSQTKPKYLDQIVGQQTSMQEVFQKLELPREWLPDLIAYAKELGIIFLATPFDEAAVEILDELAMPAFKIASFELVHLPLLKQVAQTQKPIILSTGMANLGEVEEAVAVITAQGNQQIILLHCGINYPPRFADLHLRAMETMRSAFGFPVGYSDHTPGVTVPIAAVALGAVMIEKHFTLDRNLPGPDHAFALNPEELALMVESIRQTEQALGSSVKQMVEAEQELHTLARRSIFAAVTLRAGEVLTREKLAILRPGTGLMPKYLEQLLGKTVKRDVAADEPITWDLI